MAYFGSCDRYRATLGVEIKKQYSEEANKRSLSNLRQYQDRDITDPPNLVDRSEEKKENYRDNESSVKASKVVNVGKNTIWKAEKVQKVAPDLFDDLKSGEINSVDKAYKQAVEREINIPPEVIMKEKVVEEIIIL